MKNNTRYWFIALVLMTFCMEAFAQDTVAEKNPLAGLCVFEGNVTGVPDGTEIKLGVIHTNIKSKDYSYQMTDTVRNGKFNFLWHYKTDDERYAICIPYMQELIVSANPASRTVITGNGMNCSAWIAKNDHPMQIEENEYNKFKRDSLARYCELLSEVLEKSRMMYDPKSSDEQNMVVMNERNQAVRELDAISMASTHKILDFLDSREYSPSFAREMFVVASFLNRSKHDENWYRTQSLFAKIPIAEYSYCYVMRARDILFPPIVSLRVGDMIDDFTLYDKDGMEYHLADYRNNGRYLLLEFNSKVYTGSNQTRPSELAEIYRKYSGKVTLVTINCDYYMVWKGNDIVKDEWTELHDRKNGMDIMDRFGVMSSSFVFVNPDGTILGKSSYNDFKKAFKRYLGIMLTPNTK